MFLKIILNNEIKEKAFYELGLCVLSEYYTDNYNNMYTFIQLPGSCTLRSVLLPLINILLEEQFEQQIITNMFSMLKMICIDYAIKKHNQNDLKQFIINDKNVALLLYHLNNVYYDEIKTKIKTDKIYEENKLYISRHIENIDNSISTYNNIFIDNKYDVNNIKDLKKVFYRPQILEKNKILENINKHNNINDKNMDDYISNIGGIVNELNKYLSDSSVNLPVIILILNRIILYINETYNNCKNVKIKLEDAYRYVMELEKFFNIFLDVCNTYSFICYKLFKIKIYVFPVLIRQIIYSAYDINKSVNNKNIIDYESVFCVGGLFRMDTINEDIHNILYNDNNMIYPGIIELTAYFGDGHSELVNYGKSMGSVIKSCDKEGKYMKVINENLESILKKQDSHISNFKTVLKILNDNDTIRYFLASTLIDDLSKINNDNEIMYIHKLFNTYNKIYLNIHKKNIDGFTNKISDANCAFEIRANDDNKIRFSFENGSKKCNNIGKLTIKCDNKKITEKCCGNIYDDKYLSETDNKRDDTNYLVNVIQQHNNVSIGSFVYNFIEKIVYDGVLEYNIFSKFINFSMFMDRYTKLLEIFDKQALTICCLFIKIYISSYTELSLFDNYTYIYIIYQVVSLFDTHHFNLLNENIDLIYNHISMSKTNDIIDNIICINGDVILNMLYYAVKKTTKINNDYIEKYTYLYNKYIFSNIIEKLVNNEKNITIITQKELVNDKNDTINIFYSGILIYNLLSLYILKNNNDIFSICSKETFCIKYDKEISRLVNSNIAYDTINDINNISNVENTGISIKNVQFNDLNDYKETLINKNIFMTQYNIRTIVTNEDITFTLIAHPENINNRCSIYNKIWAQKNIIVNNNRYSCTLCNTEFVCEYYTFGKHISDGWSFWISDDGNIIGEPNDKICEYIYGFYITGNNVYKTTISNGIHKINNNETFISFNSEVMQKIYRKHEEYFYKLSYVTNLMNIIIWKKNDTLYMTLPEYNKTIEYDIDNETFKVDDNILLCKIENNKKANILVQNMNNIFFIYNGTYKIFMFHINNENMICKNDSTNLWSHIKKNDCTSIFDIMNKSKSTGSPTNS